LQKIGLTLLTLKFLFAVPVRFILLTVLVVCLFLLDILTGPVAIPVEATLNILGGGESDTKAWNYILQNIRIPKAITAVLAGAALSVSGLQMQTLFRNPLASPSELGVSAGAALGTGFLLFVSGSAGSGMLNLHQLDLGNSWTLALSSAGGAALVFSILLVFSRLVRDPVILLIIGLLLGTFTLAITSIWQYYSQPDQLQAFISWTFGSLGGVTGHQLNVLAIVSIAGIFLTCSLSKTLNALLLGDNYATNLGISISRARTLILINTCLLTGAVTAFCGPIGFVGIAVPHLTRALFNTSNHLLLIPACCLMGAILLLTCDLLAQLPGNSLVLPINVATSLIGAPIVVWILFKMNHLRQSS
jgi:iron complex transport system permease protein